MNTKLLSLVVLSAACATGRLGAQTVSATPAPAAPAQAPVSAPNQTVYSQRLPGVEELSAAAAAQGLAVERIEQTAGRVTAVYRNAGGQTTTVAYLLLPGASVATAGAPAPAATGAVATPSSPAPAVVYYEPAPRVVYYSDYPGYYYGYPRYWGPPVSIGLGFGFRGGGYRGGFHGGFRH